MMQQSNYLGIMPGVNRVPGFPVTVRVTLYSLPHTLPMRVSVHARIGAIATHRNH